jgi:diguanylate cyclase (GGDEF)-like protein
MVAETPPAQHEGLAERSLGPDGEAGTDDASAALESLAELAELVGLAAAGSGRDVDSVLESAMAAVRDAGPHHAAAVWQFDADHLVARAIAGPATARIVDLPSTFGILGRAVEREAPVIVCPTAEADGSTATVFPDGRAELAVPVPGATGPWGVLLVVGSGPILDEADAELAVRAARAVGAIARAGRLAEDVEHQLHRANALRRVAGDIGGRLDLDRVLSGLVDHAIVLFGADRAAVFVQQPDGRTTATASRGLSDAYLAAVRDVHPDTLAAIAATAGRPEFAIGYRGDPRSAGLRAAVVQEGYDTICVAPLIDGTDLLGRLNVYHDRPHRWTPDELETMAALADQTAVAVRTAQNYARMAAWAAQLQSIQQLGTRLNRLTSVADIGDAIATELHQLIDYHNVRVYRLYGNELIPVAMQGHVGEYVDETAEQLRVALGEGITGWVAQHRTAQYLPDAANDSRANTIPGTEDDLDESMLLAPMVFEDQVLGVLVLSKLGLAQFDDDDLRLLVIYASFAAQAMANADATERLRAQSTALERQLRSQRDLLQITESILATLEPRAVLDQIADRLSELVGYDNISIEIYDRAARILRPLTARGIHAEEYLKEWEPGETGIATWVIEHNEPVLIADQSDDPRVRHFESTGPIHGGLIVVPLRGRVGVTGVLTVERVGEGRTFDEHEFELVKLFGAQVSIALQNAEVYRAVEIRARTDDLTGLLNHGTFREWLSESVARGEPFSLVMLDLDDFKSVNDALGHQAGDRFLRDIGRAIVGAGRESDHVFRYGGDEFTVLLPGASSAAACSVAERIAAAIAVVGGPDSPWHAEGITVSASIGLATYPDDGATADGILLAADRACFVAKRAGRGRIATADEGLALAAEFSLQEPTPVDPPTPVD